jgi:hypothetical protein
VASSRLMVARMRSPSTQVRRRSHGDEDAADDGTVFRRIWATAPDRPKADIRLKPLGLSLYREAASASRYDFPSNVTFMTTEAHHHSSSNPTRLSK